MINSMIPIFNVNTITFAFAHYMSFHSIVNSRMNIIANMTFVYRFNLSKCQLNVAIDLLFKDLIGLFCVIYCGHVRWHAFLILNSNSICIFPWSIFVGAPQAQSTLESQRKINETGAIYKCDLETHNNNNNNNADHCIPFSFDTLGNTNEENNAYTYNSEKKDHQWLGAAMDGNEFNTDKMVVSKWTLGRNAFEFIARFRQCILIVRVFFLSIL